MREDDRAAFRQHTLILHEGPGEKASRAAIDTAQPWDGIDTARHPDSPVDADLRPLALSDPPRGTDTYWDGQDSKVPPPPLSVLVKQDARLVSHFRRMDRLYYF